MVKFSIRRGPATQKLTLVQRFPEKQVTIAVWANYFRGVCSWDAASPFTLGQLLSYPNQKIIQALLARICRFHAKWWAPTLANPIVLIPYVKLALCPFKEVFLKIRHLSYSESGIG